jgi:hypothetical protein
MNKFGITIFTLVAFSTAGYAHNRSYELRESDTYFGKFSEQSQSPAAAKKVLSPTSAFPLAVQEKIDGLTSYKRTMKNSEENDHNRH